MVTASKMVQIVVKETTVKMMGRERQDAAEVLSKGNHLQEVIKDTKATRRNWTVLSRTRQLQNLTKCWKIEIFP